jgi:AcrR family transcriptional regulator
LLGAAEERFLAHGYFSTTLAQIAADAGVTKGAVYANFGSKAELFQEVRTNWARRSLGDLHAVVAKADDLEEFLEAGAAWMIEFGVATEDRQRAVFEFLVEVEGTAMSQEFLDVFHETRALARGVVADNVPRLLAVELDPENLAVQVEVFLAAVRGIGVHRQIDPDIPDEAYGQALRNLVAGVVAGARPPSSG